MTFINSGYGANNYSNSVSNTGAQDISSSKPNARATESFNKSMQGSGQDASGGMDLAKLLPLIEQLLQMLKSGGMEGGSQTEAGQGGGSSGGNSAGCGCDGNEGKKTGSSSRNEGSAGGAGSLGGKEGNGGGTISNTDKSSHKGKD